MTLLHVKNKLLSFLLNNDTLSLKDDLTLIDLKDDDNPELADHKETLLRLAAKDFADAGIIRLVDEVSQLYVITQPINSHIQQVAVSPMCAEMLADTLGAFAEANGIKDLFCNRLAVTEHDIMNLIHFFHEVLEDGGPDFDDDPEAPKQTA